MRDFPDTIPRVEFPVPRDTVQREPSLWHRFKAWWLGEPQPSAWELATHWATHRIEPAPVTEPMVALALALAIVETHIRITVFSGEGPAESSYDSKASAVRYLRMLGMKRDDARVLVNKVCADARSVDSVVVPNIGIVEVSNQSGRTF